MLAERQSQAHGRGGEGGNRSMAQTFRPGMLQSNLANLLLHSQVFRFTRDDRTPENTSVPSTSGVCASSLGYDEHETIGALLN